MFFGVQKNRLNETVEMVLWNAKNMFRLMNKKIIVFEQRHDISNNLTF